MDDHNQTPEVQQPQGPQPQPPNIPTQPSEVHKSEVIQPMQPATQEDRSTMPNNMPQALSHSTAGPEQLGSQQPVVTSTSNSTAAPIYPEPQKGFVGTSPISRASLENETKIHKKHKRLIITLICLALLVLASSGVFLYWYLHQDHSIYSKLTTENYTQNGVNISFLYPSIFQANPAKLAKLRDQYKSDSSVSEYVVYDYKPGTPQKMAINVMSLKDDGILSTLNLTPAKLLAQIEAGSGSFVDALNKNNPRAFTNLYNGCNGSIKNQANQTVVTCFTSTNGYAIEQLVAADASYQYNFYLIMPNSIWNAHPKVWEKIEKSFTY